MSKAGIIYHMSIISL